MYMQEVWDLKLNLPDGKCAMTVGACSGKASPGNEGAGQASCSSCCIGGYATQQRRR